ncbi:hypothetical protein [Enterococcus sp. HY326]|uniref:hypothetical protein n=1 Tax=Enterococcus sp. HY326 TaxID=2971265 RepID=UPI0022408267|nr:hypothetical protein [Enterococcus sp. HY326]
MKKRIQNFYKNNKKVSLIGSVLLVGIIFFTLGWYSYGNSSTAASGISIRKSPTGYEDLTIDNEYENSFVDDDLVYEDEDMTITLLGADLFDSQNEEGQAGLVLDLYFNVENKSSSQNLRMNSEITKHFLVQQENGDYTEPLEFPDLATNDVHFDIFFEEVYADLSPDSQGQTMVSYGLNGTTSPLEISIRDNNYKEMESRTIDIIGE